MVRHRKKRWSEICIEAELRAAAEDSVLAVRGSYDAPGFEACVKEEMARMTRPASQRTEENTDV